MSQVLTRMAYANGLTGFQLPSSERPEAGDGAAKKYWVSCPQFTVQVNTDEFGKIVWAAPVVRSFLGQPLDNLERWAKKRFGGITVEELDRREER